MAEQVKQFKVQGSAAEPYIVTITFDPDTFATLEDGGVLASCTCPTGEKGQQCKHIDSLMDRQAVLDWIEDSVRESIIEAERAKRGSLKVVASDDGLGVRVGYQIEDSLPHIPERQGSREREVVRVNYPPICPDCEPYWLDHYPAEEMYNRFRSGLKRAFKQPGVSEMLKKYVPQIGVTAKIPEYRIMEFLGYTADDMADHIEAQLEVNGWEWADVFTGKLHIDHIIPIAGADLTDINTFIEVFSIKNLRPLPAMANIRKGHKLED